MKLSQLFNSKPKDKLKTLTAITVKGLAKQTYKLEQEGFEKYGEVTKLDRKGNTLMYQQVMIKKVSE